MRDSAATTRQRNVRRYGASLGLVALGLLISRYVTPSGGSSPLVLVATVAVAAYFGGRWPGLCATAAAAAVNGAAVGLQESVRLAVETGLIVSLGSLLALRVSRTDDSSEKSQAIRGEAFAAPPKADAVLTVSDEDAPCSAPPARLHDSSAAISSSPATASDASSDAAPGILVVHGNTVLRLALRSTLAGLGYRTKDAANLGQAESMLAGERYGAAVVDVGRIDDLILGTLERMRAALAEPPAEGLLIVLTTAGDDDRELLMAAGADVVLQKPVDTASVAAKLAERLPTSRESQSRVGLGASP